MGRQRKFRAAALRKMKSFRVEPPFDRVLIFYRAGDEVLDAWRSMHDTRDLPRRPAEPPEVE